MRGNFIASSLLLLLLFGVRVQAAVQETKEVQESGQSAVSPEYTDPAQALAAANASATSATGDTLVKKALIEAERAEGRLAAAIEKGDLQAAGIAKAEMKRTEAACARALGGVSGVSEHDLLNMRDHGMSWREIGREVGVHPASLGPKRGSGGGNSQSPMGFGSDARGITEQELHEATARDVDSGWSSVARGAALSGIVRSHGGLRPNRSGSGDDDGNSNGDNSEGSGPDTGGDGHGGMSGHN